MSELSRAIEWKYGNTAKTKCTVDTIEEWEHPTDPKPDVAALLAEYEPERLRLVKVAQDLSDIEADPDIDALLSKRPTEINDHVRAMNSVPELREAVILLIKDAKLRRQ